MSEIVNLPDGTSMHRQGHVLVLSGCWTLDLMDELQCGLMDLRNCLPRSAGRKLVTLHLLNFSISFEAVGSALSLVRRSFIDLTVDVSVVAEGKLEEAGLLFLAGSQKGFRKVFSDLKVSMQMNTISGFSNKAKDAGMGRPNTGLLTAVLGEWARRLEHGENLCPSLKGMSKAGVYDKEIHVL